MYNRQSWIYAKGEIMSISWIYYLIDFGLQISFLIGFTERSVPISFLIGFTERSLPNHTRNP